jgi:hypothetical protein
MFRELVPDAREIASYGAKKLLRTVPTSGFSIEKERGCENAVLMTTLTKTMRRAQI